MLQLLHNEDLLTMALHSLEPDHNKQELKIGMYRILCWEEGNHVDPR